MAWHLIGAKPLPEPMMTYCQLYWEEQTSKKFRLWTLILWKCIWKCFLQNIGPTFCRRYFQIHFHEINCWPFSSNIILDLYVDDLTASVIFSHLPVHFVDKRHFTYFIVAHEIIICTGVAKCLCTHESVILAFEITRHLWSKHVKWYLTH